MKKLNLLSKAEMKNVLGGNPPLEGDCKKDCVCADGQKKEAKVSNCDAGTCDTTGVAAYCKVSGAMTFHSCATVVNSIISRRL